MATTFAQLPWTKPAQEPLIQRAWTCWTKAWQAASQPELGPADKERLELISDTIDRRLKSVPVATSVYTLEDVGSCDLPPLLLHLLSRLLDKGLAAFAVVSCLRQKINISVEIRG